MAGSHETPFKMKGSAFYGLGNASPVKDGKDSWTGSSEGTTHSGRLYKSGDPALEAHKKLHISQTMKETKTEKTKGTD